MQRLPPLPTVQEIIRIYGLTAKKKLSQNFLLDLNLTKKIVKSAGKLNGGCIIEVGPGPGGLTRSILQTDAKQVIAIEKDRRFMPSLQLLEEASDSRLKVFRGDIFEFNLQDVVPPDYKRAWQDDPPPIQVIGNLPFSVSTALVIKWLNSISTHSDLWALGRAPLTLTFQKEVAQRIVAPPKSEFRCRLSVMCQYLCHVSLKFTIPGKAFVPAPKVDVGVVKFVPKKESLFSQPFDLVEKVNRHLFHLSNKFCTKALGTLFPPEREDLVFSLLEECNISGQARPFELSNEEIGRICEAYASITQNEKDLLAYNFRSKNASRHRRSRISVLKALEETIFSEPNVNLEKKKRDRTVEDFVDR